MTIYPRKKWESVEFEQSGNKLKKKKSLNAFLKPFSFPMLQSYFT